METNCRILTVVRRRRRNSKKKTYHALTNFIFRSKNSLFFSSCLESVKKWVMNSWTSFSPIFHLQHLLDRITQPFYHRIANRSLFPTSMELQCTAVAFLALKNGFSEKKILPPKKNFFLPFFNATFQCLHYNVFIFDC